MPRLFDNNERLDNLRDRYMQSDTGGIESLHDMFGELLDITIAIASETKHITLTAHDSGEK